MLKIEHTIEEIDEKYDRVDANVKVQNEIIDSIMKNEGDSLNAAE
jgi:t-SNARE complex subunit (syntaxin)